MEKIQRRGKEMFIYFLQKVWGDYGDKNDLDRWNFITEQTVNRYWICFDWANFDWENIEKKYFGMHDEVVIQDDFTK